MEVVAQKFISPDELHRHACAYMLEGRQPVTETDWALVVNYWAVNVMAEEARPICIVLSRIYECPLSDEAVNEIVDFQLSRKE